MHHFTERSIELANGDCYLDQLFAVYPIAITPPRRIDPEAWRNVERAYENNDDNRLMHSLLALKLFPIKHPYVGYLKYDHDAIMRNPDTVQRIMNDVRAYDIDELLDRCSEPIENNRQIGPNFNDWVGSGVLNVELFADIDEFANANGNRVFTGTDAQKQAYVENSFRIDLEKGLDLLAFYNGRLVIGEAKFITTFGGTQNNQFRSAMDLLNVGIDAIRVAILDGVIYINGGNNMMQREVRESDNPIMSALVLREFLESI